MAATHFIIKIMKNTGIKFHIFNDFLGTESEYEEELYLAVLSFIQDNYRITAVSVKEFFLSWIMVHIKSFRRPSREGCHWKILHVKNNSNKECIMITQSDRFNNLSAIPIEDFHRLPEAMIEWNHFENGYTDEKLYKKTKIESVIRSNYHKNVCFFDLMLDYIDCDINTEKKKRFY